MRLLKVEVGDVYGHYSVPAHVSSDTICVKVNRFASISDVLYPCFAAEKYFSPTPFSTNLSLVHEYNNQVFVDIRRVSVDVTVEVLSHILELLEEGLAVSWRNFLPVTGEGL